VIANVFRFIVILLPGTEHFRVRATDLRTKSWPANARNVAPIGFMCVVMRIRDAVLRALLP